MFINANISLLIVYAFNTPQINLFKNPAHLKQPNAILNFCPDRFAFGAKPQIWCPKVSY